MPTRRIRTSKLPAKPDLAGSMLVAEVGSESDKGRFFQECTSTKRQTNK
ncbi:hypothetical protein [Desulfosporosinus sp.]|nr:hypothetical protein [Desulfosporosinus sp.]